MGKPNISSEVLAEIREKVGDSVEIQDFCDAFQTVQQNGILAEILSIPEADLKEQIQKLAYAKIILSDDMLCIERFEKNGSQILEGHLKK